MKRNSFIYILFVLVYGLAVVPCPLFAADSTVYYIATDGNDAGAGTQEHPFRTLEKAIAVVQPGETIYVRGGTYECDRTIIFLASGEPGKPIRVWPYRDEEPIFNVTLASIHLST
jgi:hypothetical protein